tara:strand:- start:24 stop:317 length:294 start_codon:yes stop_codon:yes gene_type:complete
MYNTNSNKMDVVKSRYGNDRSIEKLGNNKIRVMGESKFTRASEDKEGNVTMFDFEGGPCFNVGGTIRYQKSNWKILKIEPEPNKYKELASVVLEVKY